MSLINFPILYIPDPDKGRPLFSGQVFVGEPDLDPEIPSNQKQLNVIEEDGTVVPIPQQPFRLSAGGVPVYNGNPVRLDTDGDHSLKILDKLGSQIYYIENNTVDSAFEQEVIYLSFTVSAGQTVLNVPDRPNGLIFVVDGDTFEQGISGDVKDFTYDAAGTGNIVKTTAFTGNEQVFVIYGAIVAITATKPGGMLTFSTVNQMVIDVNLEEGDKVTTYFYNAEVLCEWITIAAGTGAGDMSDGTLNLTGTGLQGQLVINETMTPKHFGAVGGALDDTTQVQNCFNVSPNSVYDEQYSVTSVTAPNYVTSLNAGVLLSIGTPDSRVLTITSKSVGDIVVDGNGNAVNCIYFPVGLGYQQKYNTLDYKNVTVIVSSGVTNTGVTMFGDDVVGGAIYGDGMVNDGHSNGSFPQGCVTGDGSYNIKSHYIKNSVSGFVTTGGNVFIETTHSINMTDNGCYLLGGDVKIISNYYQGNEEGLVAAGVNTLDVGEDICVGRCLGGLRYQNAGNVTIGRLVGVPSVAYDDPTFAANVPIIPILARSGNAASGNITIGSLEGFWQLGVATNAGTVEKIDIKSGDITLCRAPSLAPLNVWDVNPTANNLWDWQGCKQFSRKNVTVKIKNFDAGVWPAGIMSVQHPTLTRFSEIESETFHILEADDTETLSATEWRGGRPQAQLVYNDVCFRNIAGSLHMVNANQSGNHPMAVNAPPADGYFRAGQILWDNTGTNIQFVCSVAGDPATFITK